MLIVSLDQYIVVVALPEIGRDLGYSSQTLQLVISAYAVASAGFLLLGGRAADLLGRRRVLIAGLALYGGASVAGGLATVPEVQLAARAVQGLGGALVFPATLSLVNTTFAEGRERNHALAVWGGAGAAGLVIGVLLGGVLTQAFGWEAVFFVNVPLIAAAIPLALRLIAADGARDADRSFDVPGALSATLGVTLLVFALVQGPDHGWGSPAILGAGAAGALLLAGFALVERRSPDPLVRPRLLANRNLATAVATAFMFMATFGALLYFLSLYFQDVRGYDALQTGVGFLLPTAFVVAGSTLAGRLVTVCGLRATLVGALATGVAGAARARADDLPGRLLRRADPRADPRERRRRHRLHRDVHRRRHRRRRPRAGRRLGHRVDGRRDRRRRRPGRAGPDRQRRHRRPRRRAAADRDRGRHRHRRARHRGRHRGDAADRPEPAPRRAGRCRGPVPARTAGVVLSACVSTTGRDPGGWSTNPHPL